MPFRFDHRNHVEVFDDVNRELAQTGGGARFVVNRVAVEVLQLQVRTTRVDRLLWHFAVVDLLLEPFQGVHELINVAHHFRRRVPGLVLGVVLQKDDNHGGDVVDTRGRFLQRLGFTQIFLVQSV